MFNLRLFLLTSHFCAHLPGHLSSRSPAFSVTSVLLHASVRKGNVSRNLTICSSTGKRAHAYLYVPLLVHRGGSLAIQVGHYSFSFFFCLASEMLHTPDQYSHEVPGKGAGCGCLLLQGKSPLIPQLFHTINSH